MVTYVITIAILLSMAWGKHLIIETEDTAKDDHAMVDPIYGKMVDPMGHAKNKKEDL